MLPMLSHKLLTRKDIGKAANYYLDAVDDYYAKTLDSTAWQGKGAVVLALEGAVESETQVSSRLCDTRSH